MDDPPMLSLDSDAEHPPRAGACCAVPSGRHETVGFSLAPEVAALGVEVATLAIGGLRNRRSDPAFDAVFTEAIAAIAAGAKAEDLPGDPVLRGFREPCPQTIQFGG